MPTLSLVTNQRGNKGLMRMRPQSGGSQGRPGLTFRLRIAMERLSSDGWSPSDFVDQSRQTRQLACFRRQ